MSSATEGSVRLGGSTGMITVPTGIAGINTFSTPEWWANALSVPDSDHVERRTITEPGAAVGVVPDDSAVDAGSSVVMITRPLIDWLPEAVRAGTAEDRTQPLLEWAEAVLTWTAVAPVRMIITRTDPATVADLVDAAAGHSRTGDPIVSQPNDAAAAFETAMVDRLQNRRAAISAIDRQRCRAAIDAVAVAGAGADGAYDSEVRAVSVDVRDRLIDAGVRIHGPRTGLVYPDAPTPDLPLDVAAEASLAVLLAALDDPAATAGDESDSEPNAAALRELRTRLQQAQRDLAGRRADPRNIKRVGARSVIKKLVVGARRG